MTIQAQPAGRPFAGVMGPAPGLCAVGSGRSHSRGAIAHVTPPSAVVWGPDQGSTSIPGALSPTSGSSSSSFNVPLLPMGLFWEGGMCSAREAAPARRARPPRGVTPARQPFAKD